MKRISILGSTGSIGTSALNVIANHADLFEVVGLAEGHDTALLARQIEKFKPKLVSVRDEQSVKKLKSECKGHLPEIVFGMEGASLVASMNDADIVVSAIVGAAGLLPTIEAIKKGKRIALANKETMVVGGELVTSLSRKHNAFIIPVDSEHSAIFQSLIGHRKEDVRCIILTASGGPFRTFTKEQMEKVSVEDALKHPRWTMGAKITIDSATLMNKGLEVIEAKWLFDLKPEEIEVVIHPESVIHSMVEYRDGCIISQLGVPDMRAPIAYALSYPARIKTQVERLDFSKVKGLTFEKPDHDKFPCLRLAYDALKSGQTYPVVLNAANEVGVAAFLDRKIPFISISKIVSRTIEKHDATLCENINEILNADKWARETAANIIKNLI